MEGGGGPGSSRTGGEGPNLELRTDLAPQGMEQKPGFALSVPCAILSHCVPFQSKIIFQRKWNLEYLMERF